MADGINDASVAHKRQVAVTAHCLQIQFIRMKDAKLVLCFQRKKQYPGAAELVNGKDPSAGQMLSEKHAENRRLGRIDKLCFRQMRASHSGRS